MKKGFLLTVAVMLIAGAAAVATPPPVYLGQQTLGVPIEDACSSQDCKFHQVNDRTLSADTLYTLNGIYYVDPGATLTIPAGTVIQGYYDEGADVSGAGTIIVRKGAQIFAEGTPENPIVFTSGRPEGLGVRSNGDLGGIVILGEAPVNKVDPEIEGGLVDDPATVENDAIFGGSDPEDNSGILKYVRIEYPGFRFAEGNEINGLTMGGVGRGTEIHHIQVSYSDDDNYEWFGGNVNCDYLIAAYSTDDDFDSDFGYRGRCQFLFSIDDPEVFDPTGETRGFESDNDNEPGEDEPFTHGYFVNCTLVGPARTDAAIAEIPGDASFDYSAVIRRSSQTSVYNSVIMGWPWGLSIRDDLTHQWALDDTLQFQNVSIAAFLEKVDGQVHDKARWDMVQTWFDTPAFNNSGSLPRNPDTIMLTDMSSLHNPNPIPAPGSELIGSASFANPKLAGFQVVTYRGAFDPSLPRSEQWDMPWANYDPDNVAYVTAVHESNDPLPDRQVLAENYPNPFNPLTTIKFSVPRAGEVTLKVHDVRGQLVQTLVEQSLERGTYETTFEGSGLASGTYFYTIGGNGYEETYKMQLVK